MAPRNTKIIPALRRLGAATAAIGIATGLAASRITPKHRTGVDQTRRLLHQVRGEARAARAVAPNPALRMSLRKTEAALSEIERVTNVDDWHALRALDDELCASAEAAVLYLSTGQFMSAANAGFVAIQIQTGEGLQSFTIASGTSQSNIILAINALKGDLGVRAAQTDFDPGRIAVSTLQVDGDAWMQIHQTDPSDPGIVITFPWQNSGKTFGWDRGANALTLSPFRP